MYCYVPKGEEDVRIPSSGEDGGEVAKALCGEPPGVIVVLRVSAEPPNDVDLTVDDANGDSAELLLPVGVRTQRFWLDFRTLSMLIQKYLVNWKRRRQTLQPVQKLWEYFQALSML